MNMDPGGDFESDLSLQDISALRVGDSPSPSLFSSSLSRLSSPSVRISELLDRSGVNPRPPLREAGYQSQSDGDEDDNTNGDEFVSLSKLRLASGVEDLREVTYLEMRVDTTKHTLGDISLMLPNIVQLKLNDSHILSIRDIGTSLSSLRVLWMSRCGLQNVDGASVLDSVEELYLPFNELSEIGPLIMLEKVEILDLESNNISDESQFNYISHCSNLRSLTLEGNPVCRALASTQASSGAGYRDSVKRMVPSLLLLDDQPVVGMEGDLATRSSIVLESLGSGTDQEWKLVKEGIKKRTLSTFDNDSGGPSGGSAVRPPSSRGVSPSVVRERPATSLGHYAFQSPGLSSSSSSSFAEDCGRMFSQDTSSRLTHGLNQVICGNPVRALRARKKHGLGGQSPAPVQSPEPVSADQDVLEELKVWRQQYSRMSQGVDPDTSSSPLSRPSSTPGGRIPHSTGDSSSESRSETKSEIETTEDLVITKTSSITDLEEDEAASEGEKGSREPEKGTTGRDHRAAAQPPPPHPPSSQAPPTGRRRVLPAPPSTRPSHPPRPHTAADFRMRRFRRRASETAISETVSGGGGGDQGKLLSDAPPTTSVSVDGRRLPPHHQIRTTSPENEKLAPRPPKSDVDPVLIASTETKKTHRRRLPKPKQSSTASGGTVNAHET